jgi:integrase/recombinase XerD
VLPRTILTEEEVKRLVNAPDTRTPTGYRNRVIIEVLYDTAVRRSELTGIRLMDLDLAAGFILIRGKGAKERVVPLGDRVCERVKNYALSVRPAFVKGADPGYLILNRWGSRLSSNGVWAMVKRCAQLAGIERNITPHGLRHTCATHMLKNGAPVRHLQEMLGHESLESTQIYTRVTITDLKKIHARYHPGENL